MKAFERQIASDELQGYHYVGYHSYAKRRYYEMVQRKCHFSCALLNGINSRLSIADFEALCLGVPKPVNTTCSWRGFDEREDKKRSEADWFKNCACHMISGK